MKRRFAPLAAGLAALVLIGSSAVMAHDDGSSDEMPVDGAGFSIIPAGGAPLGVPYEEWAGNWWRWIMSFTADTDPGITGDCQGNQGGDVFYIPHVGPGTTMESSCTIRNDQHVLVTGGATIYAMSDEGCETEESLRACIESDLTADPPIFSDVRVAVNGQDVDDIDSYLVISPPIEIEYTEDNVWGGEPGTTDQHMIGGWFVMLEPLPIGNHTIEAHDAIDLGESGPQSAHFVANVEVVGVTD